MTTHALKTELIGLEKRFWQAIKDKDAVTAMLLTDETCIVTGPQGVGLISREQLEKMINNSDSIINSFEFKDDIKVRQVSDDVAVLAYNVHEELTVEGKPVVLDAAESSTWVRRHGRWVCALHNESLLGDHYGRDRKTN